MAAVPDGRLCKLCAAAEDSKDPIHPTKFRRWGYAPKGDPPKNTGFACYICLKTYKARFMLRYKSTKELVMKLYSDDEVKEEFTTMSQCCCETCQKVDTPAVRRQAFRKTCYCLGSRN